MNINPQKKIGYIFSFLMFEFFTPFFSIVYAQNVFEEALPKELQSKTLESVITNVLTFMQDIGIALVAIFIIYAAIQLMVSGGEEKKITEARAMLTFSIIGLAVILLAEGLTYAVLETLKVNKTYLPSAQISKEQLSQNTKLPYFA